MTVDELHMFFFFFKQKTAYELRISDWSSDMCSSDLFHRDPDRLDPQAGRCRRAGKDICRQAGISVPTYYKWKSKYGGLEASELRRVKDLEARSEERRGGTECVST